MKIDPAHGGGSREGSGACLCQDGSSNEASESDDGSTSDLDRDGTVGSRGRAGTGGGARGSARRGRRSAASRSRSRGRATTRSRGRWGATASRATGGRGTRRGACWAAGSRATADDVDLASLCSKTAAITKTNEDAGIWALLDEPGEGAAGNTRVRVQGLLAIRGWVGIDLEDVRGSTAGKGNLLVDAADGINRSVDGQGLAEGESNGRKEDDGESHVGNG